MTEITNEQLVNYQIAKENLDIAKATELALRNELCEKILNGQHKGTAHFVGFGLAAAVTAKVIQKLIPSDLDEIIDGLNPDEIRCIKYEPKLIASELKKLPENSNLFRAIETKAGQPSLSIKHIEEK